MAFDTERWKRDAKAVILRWDREGKTATPAMTAMIEACEEIEELRAIVADLEEQIADMHMHDVGLSA